MLQIFAKDEAGRTRVSSPHPVRQTTIHGESCNFARSDYDGHTYAHPAHADPADIPSEYRIDTDEFVALAEATDKIIRCGDRGPG